MGIGVLPSELLLAIFSAGSIQTTSKEIPFPFLVAQVCRDWKALALNTSHIWANIYISWRIPHFLVTKWFYYSREHRLSVVIDATHMDCDMEWIDALVSILHPHMPRVRSLALTIRHQDDMNHWLDSVISYDATSLEHLMICALTLSTFFDERRVLFQNADNVRSLHLIRIQASYFATNVKNLTSLCVSDFSPTFHEFSTIFINCPSLETLILPNFSNFPSDIPRADDSHQIDALSLRRLAISFKSTTVDSCATRFLYMPQIRNLEISGRYLMHLNDLLLYHTEKNPMRNLETLRLNDITFPLESAWFCKWFSAISHLELVNCRYHPPIFDPPALILEPGSPFPFPNLRCIAYHNIESESDLVGISFAVEECLSRSDGFQFSIETNVNEVLNIDIRESLKPRLVVKFSLACMGLIETIEQPLHDANGAEFHEDPWGDDIEDLWDYDVGDISDWDSEYYDDDDDAY